MLAKAVRMIPARTEDEDEETNTFCTSASHFIEWCTGFNWFAGELIDHKRDLERE